MADSKADQATQAVTALGNWHSDKLAMLAVWLVAAAVLWISHTSMNDAANTMRGVLESSAAVAVASERSADAAERAARAMEQISEADTESVELLRQFVAELKNENQ